MAIELAAFDLLPQHMSSFARGFSAALIATTFCYPLDTLRWGGPVVFQAPHALPALLQCLSSCPTLQHVHI